MSPGFPRLHEYCGVWAMEERAAQALWDHARLADLAAHVAEAGRRADAGPEAGAASAVERVAAGRGQTVAVVPVVGTLMKQRSSLGGTSTVQLRRDVRQLAADPDVGAILLAVESPGGVAAGTDDLAREVAAARRRKPVWAHVDDLAASAAYWVASQAEQVFANSSTALVGSIGTMLTVYDASGSAERNGVKALLFATGPLKGAGTYGTPVSEQQQAYFQGIVNSMQAEFDEAVRTGRRLSAQELADVRTGAVFPAGRAQQLRLIDGVQPLERTIEMLARAAGKRNGK